MYEYVYVLSMIPADLLYKSHNIPIPPSPLSRAHNLRQLCFRDKIWLDAVPNVGSLFEGVGEADEAGFREGFAEEAEAESLGSVKGGRRC